MDETAYFVDMFTAPCQNRDVQEQKRALLAMPLYVAGDQPHTSSNSAVDFKQFAIIDLERYDLVALVQCIPGYVHFAGMVTQWQLTGVGAKVVAELRCAA
jgi:hypothetical protein